ncbi:hypothetical protein [Fluviicola sp.]|uniref:hypothetical protein n=1 Tax=Fluviicola sp. TaxID=1917219 RepID=UPI003D2A2E67
MEQYRNMVARILKETSIPEDDIFDFESSPHCNEFNQAFKFYDEAISRNAHFGIEPHLLFYKKSYSINAAATKENEHYIININAGTIVHLMERFKPENVPLNDEYADFQNLLDVSIANLMYNTALHFTFYHELAHLIQKSDLLDSTLFERPDTVSRFSIERHILELDADTFSSLCVGTHLLQYARQCFGENMDCESIKKLIVVACGSALLYLLSFQSNALPIYYEEYTHPHPVVRISCVVFHIVGYCLQSLEEYQLELDIQDIVKEAMSFAHSISSNGNDRSIIEQYQEIIGQEAHNIEAYIRKTRIIQETTTSLSAYKWNQEVRRRNR